MDLIGANVSHPEPGRTPYPPKVRPTRSKKLNSTANSAVSTSVFGMTCRDQMSRFTFATERPASQHQGRPLMATTALTSNFSCTLVPGNKLKFQAIRVRTGKWSSFLYCFRIEIVSFWGICLERFTHGHLLKIGWNHQQARILLVEDVKLNVAALSSGTHHKDHKAAMSFFLTSLKKFQWSLETLDSWSDLMLYDPPLFLMHDQWSVWKLNFHEFSAHVSFC